MSIIRRRIWISCISILVLITEIWLLLTFPLIWIAAQIADGQEELIKYRKTLRW